MPDDFAQDGHPGDTPQQQLKKETPRSGVQVGERCPDHDLALYGSGKQVPGNLPMRAIVAEGKEKMRKE